MSETFINQVTLDCLLNKEMFGKHIQNQKMKLISNKERQFYKKRIYNLFKEIITEKEPYELLPDVKYAYDNFIQSCIHYFKTIDNNDLIQAEYNEITNDSSLNNSTETQFTKIHTETDRDTDTYPNTYPNTDVLFSKSDEADKLLMRSIKLDNSTLDKYVKRTSTTVKPDIILPKQKKINLQDPELKNKGIKKKNINNTYEDDTKKKDT